ncbi:MAG: hypothetical protein B7Z10_03720 [Rhodobacterales bacterium 32-66-7]|nr:MAG: hypothetical protein B7Z31_10420 [Rhodobacterales bacterium 12-65-15]OYX26310.1 MAG: hypothetical protein B7Z10_03720 [Rhodobacterales bacterium 32-66-7]
MTVVLMLGSAPMVTEAALWPRAPFDRIVAINNAWRVRPDWDISVFPHDFPVDRHPVAGPGQRLVTETEFVPAQNAYGGFVHAGATMAFTTAYWALHALKPRVIAVFGCDMQYPIGRTTHFYGNGAPDPLRKDITLRSLEAKSARLMVLAAMQGCAMVNLSQGPSRLIFPHVARPLAAEARPLPHAVAVAAEALAGEAALGYTVPSGRYWEEAERFDPLALDRLDALWLEAARLPLRQSA